MRDQVFSATNSTLGGYNLSALVSLEREEIRIDQIQEEIFSRVQENCLANYGVNVLDVSIMRLSFPDNNLDKVFEQMRAEREGAITEIINAAEEKVNKTKTEAEEDAANKVAEGVTEAAKIKAETEKEVAALYAKAQSANIELYKFLKNLDTIVSSVNSSTVLIVKANEYPFNILTEYSKYMDVEGDKTVIRDLTYILTQLDEADRTALVTAVGALIEDAANKNGVTMP
jgi:membrane protease subunit HflC